MIDKSAGLAWRADAGELAVGDRRPRTRPAPPHAGPVVRGHRSRVLFLLGSLDGGGAERLAVNLAAACDPAAVSVKIGLLRREGSFLLEADPRRVLAARSASLWFAPFEIAAMIRASRAEVIMSFGLGVNMLTGLALRTMGRARPRWICREDSNLDAEIGEIGANPALRSAVTAAARLTHRSADCVHAVSSDLALSLQRRGAVEARRLSVIYNPIDSDLIRRRALEPLARAPRRPFVVSAGRLVRQKGHDLLIEAFARCPACAEHDLVILGKGPLETALRRQAATLGISDRTHLPGFQTNPWAWFARARLFVLPSRWEGFGNVVGEAMACGAPTLVTDCDFGPREQVQHGLSGWVTPTGEAAGLADTMDLLLGQQDLARRLAERGRARASHFDLGPIARAYTRLFVTQAA